MVTTVNTQTLATSVASGAPSRRAERPDAEQVFKALDSGDKGYLTADDLQAVVVKISAEGARRADAAGPSAPSAQEMLARLDGDGDGKVTRQEFSAAEPKVPPTDGAQGAKPAGDQPPAGAAGAGAGSQAASGTSSSSETYEPADTNEDGKVSAQEQQAYDAKLAAQKAAETASDARTAEANAAVKAYAAVEQLGQGSSTAP